MAKWNARVDRLSEKAKAALAAEGSAWARIQALGAAAELLERYMAERRQTAEQRLAEELAGPTQWLAEVQAALRKVTAETFGSGDGE